MPDNVLELPEHRIELISAGPEIGADGPLFVASANSDEGLMTEVIDVRWPLTDVRHECAWCAPFLAEDVA